MSSSFVYVLTQTLTFREPTWRLVVHSIIRLGVLEPGAAVTLCGPTSNRSSSCSTSSRRRPRVKRCWLLSWAHRNAVEPTQKVDPALGSDLSVDRRSAPMLLCAVDGLVLMMPSVFVYFSGATLANARGGGTSCAHEGLHVKRLSWTCVSKLSFCSMGLSTANHGQR